MPQRRENQHRLASKKLVVVALSAAVSDADVAECAAAGMCGHLCKPLRSDALEQLRRYISVGARPRAAHKDAVKAAGD